MCFEFLERDLYTFFIIFLGKQIDLLFVAITYGNPHKVTINFRFSPAKLFSYRLHWKINFNSTEREIKIHAHEHFNKICTITQITMHF